MDVAKMKVVELKKELKLRGLSTDGAKADLIERLQEALISGDKDDSGEDLLNEEADKLLEDDKEEDKVMEEVEEKGPVASPPKAKLNRNIAAVSAKAVDAKGDEKELTAKGDKKELTEEERQKLRAEKFGLPEGSDDKKAQRAARFGLTSTAKTENGKDSDALKKQRAERFGITVSEPKKPTQTKETSEVLKKRAERFGIITTDADKKDGLKTGPSLTSEEKKRLLEIAEEKKKQRADRFGTIDPPKDTDKKKQRAERFGTNEHSAVKRSSDSSDLEEKKKLRAERFQTST